MFDWMERKLAAGDPPYVVAGVVHYDITDITRSRTATVASPGC